MKKWTQIKNELKKRGKHLKRAEFWQNCTIKWTASTKVKIICAKFKP
jgi:hypothetical protein